MWTFVKQTLNSHNPAKDALCQGWPFVKAAIVPMCPYCLPLEKEITIYFLGVQGCSVPSLDEIGPVVLEKKMNSQV